MKDTKGFTLIEILIVVLVIGILTAIAVPSFLRARMSANESSAASSLRIVGVANVSYATTYGTGFTRDLNYLGPPTGDAAASSTAANLTDSILSGSAAAVSNKSTKSGYGFTYTGGTGCSGAAATCVGYSVLAVPSSASTGHSTFCIDNTNVLFKDPTGAVKTGNANGCQTAGFALPTSQFGF